MLPAEFKPISPFIAFFFVASIASGLPNEGPVAAASPVFAGWRRENQSRTVTVKVLVASERSGARTVRVPAYVPGSLNDLVDVTVKNAVEAHVRDAALLVRGRGRVLLGAVVPRDDRGEAGCGLAGGR
ncbi:hypothetical protein GCM10020001_063780 [Nonomuraea salmonea]